MATHSSILAWRIPWTEEPDRLQSTGLQELDTTQQLNNNSNTLTSNAEEAEVEWFYEDLQDLLELTPKKDVLFTIGDWKAKIGSQEILGITGKFDLGVQNEAGQG